MNARIFRTESASGPSAHTTHVGAESATPYLGDAISDGRRRFVRGLGLLGGVASGAAVGAGSLLLPISALAQKAGERQIHELRGNVKINGTPATSRMTIRAGDKIVTGSDGYIVFVIAESAALLRSRSELSVEAPAEGGSALLFAGLRLITGALGATFKRGTPVSLRTANATIGIRGTGVYMETRGEGTYFCTCWGKTELTVNNMPRHREWVESTRHNPRLIAYKPDKDGTYILPAPFETHTDAEMDMLEKCVGRRAPWIKS
jgi:hypothetical protein